MSKEVEPKARPLRGRNKYCIQKGALRSESTLIQGQKICGKLESDSFVEPHQVKPNCRSVCFKI